MHISTNKAIKMIFRGMKNYYANKPICVSFEVLTSCNLNCHHCNCGGQVEETLLIPLYALFYFSERCNMKSPIINENISIVT